MERIIEVFVKDMKDIALALGWLRLNLPPWMDYEVVEVAEFEESQRA